MIRGYLIELILLLGLGWLIVWGLVKLYFIARRETDADHQETRTLKREAEDTLDDLERAVERASKRRHKR